MLKVHNKFKSSAFGEKLDYSGYDQEIWHFRDFNSHLAQIVEIKQGKTLTEQRDLEKKEGVCYSECLRLPYFDIVRYHCVDVMHNLLLVVSIMMNIWKSLGLLTSSDKLELIQ